MRLFLAFFLIWCALTGFGNWVGQAMSEIHWILDSTAFLFTLWGVNWSEPYALLHFVYALFFGAFIGLGFEWMAKDIRRMPQPLERDVEDP